MQTIERIVAGEVASPNEESVDRALRPTKLKDYVGQPKACEQLSVLSKRQSPDMKLWTIYWFSDLPV